MASTTLPHTIDAGTEITAIEHQENYVALRDTINGDIEGGIGNNLKAKGVTAREIDDNLHAALSREGLLQEGVVEGTALKVTPGAGLNLNYATGTAWVTDDSAIVAGSTALIPISVTGASVTVGSAHATNPRIDQIILTLTGYGTGTVSVLPGTATGGATLANRTGAASLPAGAIRLADVLVPALFAGPFVQNTHLRDRRPWARGAYAVVNPNGGGDYSIISSSFTDIGTSLSLRVECSGAPLVVILNATVGNGNNVQKEGKIRLMEDAAAILEEKTIYSPTGNFGIHTTFIWSVAPTAGSHLYSFQWRTSDGTYTQAMRRNGTDDPVLIIAEQVRQAATDNSGA